MNPIPPTIDYATPVRSHRRVILWIVFAAVLSLALITLLILGLRQMPAPVVTAPLPAIMPPQAPTRVTIVQRQRLALPGSNGTVIASIGDITRGQTLLTVTDLNGNPLLNTVSVRPGEMKRFAVGSAAFDIEVVELNNFLAGDDFGIFAIRAAGAALSAHEKIERLIESVAKARGLKFIRNGREHSSEDAAQHLRRKYQAAGGKDISAQRFIDDLASRSSVSGEAYRVKLPEGREMPSKEWFIEQLDQIEADHGSTTKPAR